MSQIRRPWVSFPPCSFTPFVGIITPVGKNQLSYQSIVGTLLISFLRNGCTLLGISTIIKLVVIGAIIIGAVALDQVARSKAEAG